VLFDLDGTLLPMDQNLFIRAYYKYLAEYFTNLGYEPKKFLDTLYDGVGKMLDNDGSKTNEEVFWDTFTSVYGEKAKADEEHFAKFYANDTLTPLIRVQSTIILISGVLNVVPLQC